MQTISHRGLGRWRANKDVLRNLGSPYVSTRKVVREVQVAKPQDLEDGDRDGGVSCSSGEASNDRGAKSWQIVTV
jgi:hypothetical protein